MPQPKELKLFALVMIRITAVMSLSSIAYMATIGLQNVAFFAFAALLFFVPSALISAELGGMLTSNNGGVYTWVSTAFGKNSGLIAIWMEWFNNVIAAPANIAPMVATFAYVGFPTLAHNATAMFFLLLLVTWAMTFFNFLPIGKVAVLSVVGGVFGMILPGILLISCAIYWVISGAPLQVSFSTTSDWVPVASFATFALLVKVLGSYSGIQAVSFHTRNIKNPRVNVPISMLITVIIIFCVTTLASVSLAAIVPSADRNALNGLIQAIAVVMHRLNLDWVAQIISLFVCVGMLAAASIWILSPARGMQEVAIQGMVPKIFAKTNKHGMPIGVLLIQAVICSLLATLFLLMPSVEAAFAMIIALTSQFTVMMWILVFVSAIRLRYVAKDMERPFRIGKTGNGAMIFWATLGIIACSCGFFLGLFPPKFSHVQNIAGYVSLMIIADIIIIAIPFAYIKYRKLLFNLNNRNY
jgi:amino acid transporter